MLKVVKELPTETRSVLLLHTSVYVPLKDYSIMTYTVSCEECKVTSSELVYRLESTFPPILYIGSTHRSSPLTFKSTGKSSDDVDIRQLRSKRTSLESPIRYL